MASSANPGETIYTIEANAALPRITAIRLEALPDPSLPKGGPGRDIYGNFQLNGFEAAAQPLERGVVATAGRRARLEHRGSRTWHSRPSRRTTAARASTASSRRRCPATSTRRADGGSTPAARTPGCRGRSSSPSIGRWTLAGRRAAADSAETSGRRCRAGARPLPAVGHLEQHSGSAWWRSRRGCGPSWRSPRRIAPSSSARISRRSTAPSHRR